MNNIYAPQILPEMVRHELQVYLTCAQICALSPVVSGTLKQLNAFLNGQIPLHQLTLTHETAVNPVQEDRLSCDFLVKAIGYTLTQGGRTAILEPMLVLLLRLEDLFYSKKEQTVNFITLQQAQYIAQKAEEQAKKIGVPMVIAVVDAGGNLVLHERMEHALLVSINIALNKAYTAVALKSPTDQLAAITQPGAHLYGIQHSDPRVIVFGGGIPIKKDGEIIGGLGISGGSVEQDMSIAQYALKAINKLLTNDKQKNK